MKCRNHFVKRDSCSTIPPTPHIIRFRMGVVFFCNGGDLLLQLECVNWIRTSSRSGCCRRK